MKKKLIFCVLTVVVAAVLMLALPASAAGIGGTCGDNTTWELEDGILTISGTGAVTSNPWIEYQDQISRAVVKSGVTELCDSAFEGCTNLFHITLEPGITYIGMEAFSTGSSFTNAYFQGDAPTFDYYWRYGTYVFVYYPADNETWTAVEQNSMYPVNYGNSGTCGENLTYSIDGTVLTISGTGKMDDYSANYKPLWEAYEYDITKVIIEDGVTSIGYNAFSQFVEMTEIVIPNSVTEIGGMGLKDCFSLTSINLPEGLEVIHSLAFDSCTGLAKIEIPASITWIHDNAFMHCDNLNEFVFKGDPPKMFEAFLDVVAEVWYPADNENWTEDKLQDYAGTLTWRPYCSKTHTEETVAGKAAGCTEAGLTEGKRCTVCEVVTVAQETVPATGHSFGSWKEVKAATTDENGLEERICTRCDHKEQRTLDKLEESQTETSQPESNPAETETTQPETEASEPAETQSPTSQSEVTESQTEQSMDGTVNQPTEPAAAQEEETDGEKWITVALTALLVLACGAAAAVFLIKKHK